MLLRSSSTPMLGSLSSSSSSSFHFTAESPTNHHHHHHHHSLLSSSCRLSPLSDSSDHHPTSPFRRANSDGNLHSLLLSHSSSRPVLHSIPSFSVYNSHPEEPQQDEEDEEEEEFGTVDWSSMPTGESIRKDLAFAGGKEGMQSAAAAASPLFLARGLGIDRLASGLLDAGGDGCSGGGGGGDGCSVFTTGGGGERSDAEMYYRKMVEEDPSNALVLRNYAQFLYETKGDPRRAEEYYSRAILAEPGDGEILSKYAKLVWELHHDEDRASSYFEQAVQAAPSDSHVLAAYAEFLWETEEEAGDGSRENDPLQDHTRPPVHHAALASVSA